MWYNSRMFTKQHSFYSNVSWRWNTTAPKRTRQQASFIPTEISSEFCNLPKHKQCECFSILSLHMVPLSIFHIRKVLLLNSYSGARTTFKASKKVFNIYQSTSNKWRFWPIRLACPWKSFEDYPTLHVVKIRFPGPQWTYFIFCPRVLGSNFGPE